MAHGTAPLAEFRLIGLVNIDASVSPRLPHCFISCSLFTLLVLPRLLSSLFYGLLDFFWQTAVPVIGKNRYMSVKTHWQLCGITQNLMNSIRCQWAQADM